MQEYVETLHDLRVKYSDTFVGLVLPGGDTIPARVQEICADPDTLNEDDEENEDSHPAEDSLFVLAAHVSKEDFSKTMTMTVVPSVLNLKFPPLGVREVGMSAVYYGRIANLSSPAKYRKTISTESLRYFDPSYRERAKAKIGGNFNTDIGEYLYHCYNGTPYRTIKESVELLINGERLGCALSNVYSIHVSMNVEELLIAREGHFIAAYLPQNGTVKFMNRGLDCYREELSELGFTVDDGSFYSVFGNFEEKNPLDAVTLSPVDEFLQTVDPSMYYTTNPLWPPVNPFLEVPAPQVDFSLEAFEEQ